MQIASRLLIAGYIVAAIAWSIALIPPRIIGGDLGTAMIFVTAFGCTQVLLALLFLGSAITAAVTLVRGSARRSIRSFVILGLAFVSFAATSCYSWFYFYA